MSTEAPARAAAGPGEAASARVAVQRGDFDLAAEVDALHRGDGRVGAVAAFVGTVRERNDGREVSTLELEHYPGMTERVLESLIDAAIARFGIVSARIVHRVGPLRSADRIMMVAVVAAHRGAAFEACEFLMDHLKTQAPFWKKETTPEGPRWVDARVADEAAMARWAAAAPTAARPPGAAPES